jgi:hypothetical protein
MKRRFVQTFQNIGLVDTVFEEQVCDKFYLETCNLFYHMPSDLINRKKKNLKDRFTMLARHIIGLRRRKSKRT